MGAEGVARPRRLTVSQVRRLDLLRRVARLLDSAIPVPGTTRRIGLDPLLGLVPGLGDLVSPAFTLAVLWHAVELGVPKVVQLRMLVNVAVDALVGLVPGVGDLFDVAWRAGERNYALLATHVHEERRPTAADWAFVLLVFGLVVAVALVPVLVAVWFLRRLVP
ncbi:MAG: DUF4112 domain-containing protein [Acidobacteria bacterium]|nr:DUF4112 domain-containing protein [Acidobacteriota bacterium]